MDDPQGDRMRLERTLRQFRLINMLFSRDRALTRKFIIADILQRRLPSVTLLDVGCGGGDFAVWFSLQMRRAGVKAAVLGLDADTRTVDYCNRRHPTAGVDFKAGRIGDVGTLWPGVTVDYIFANNLLHHLDDGAIPFFILAILARARRGVLLIDIERSRGALLWFSLFSRLFLHRSFARQDGLISIRKGFSVKELQWQVNAAGHASLSIGRCAPGRIYLTNLVTARVPTLRG